MIDVLYKTTGELVDEIMFSVDAGKPITEDEIIKLVDDNSSDYPGYESIDRIFLDQTAITDSAIAGETYSFIVVYY